MLAENSRRREIIRTSLSSHVTPRRHDRSKCGATCLTCRSLKASIHLEAVVESLSESNQY
jgi:hypothetical protein